MSISESNFQHNTGNAVFFSWLILRAVCFIDLSLKNSLSLPLIFISGLPLAAFTTSISVSDTVTSEPIAFIKASFAAKRTDNER